MLESVEARPSTDSAEAIAARLIERLADVSAAARQAGASRAHIRVVKDGVEVTLTVDLDAHARQSKGRRVKRSKGHAASSRRVNKSKPRPGR